jgi:hypothetical protein
MMNCRANHGSSTSAVEEDIMTSFVHRVIREQMPILQEAITTADKLMGYLASKEKPMDVNSLKPLVLEQFLHGAQSHVRAVNAVNWLNENLQLGWLCPLGTMARLASTCTMIQEPAVAAHLIFRTLTLHRLRAGLNSEGMKRRPGSGGHYNRLLSTIRTVPPKFKGIMGVDLERRTLEATQVRHHTQ